MTYRKKISHTQDIRINIMKKTVIPNKRGQEIQHMKVLFVVMSTSQAVLLIGICLLQHWWCKLRV